MEPSIQLVKVQNPFRRMDRDYQVVPYHGESLFNLRNNHFAQDEDIVISINGKVIPYEELGMNYAIPGDCVLFVKRIEGGDAVRMVAMLAVVVVAAIATWYVGGAGGWAVGGLVGTLNLGATAGLLAGMAVMVAGGLLVNALLPVAPISLPSVSSVSAGSISSSGSGSNSSDYDKTNYYGWNPQTTQQQGGTLPRFYGNNKLVGNIVSAYTEPINDDNYLNVLVHLGQGPYNSITNLKINDQPIANFDGVTSYIRYGRLNQEVIPNFNDTKTEYPMSVLVAQGNPFTYQTLSSDSDRVEVEITFPNGLYYSNDSGGLDAHSISFSIRAVGVTKGNYYDLASSTTVTGSATHVIKRVYGANVIRDKYNITVTRHTGNQSSFRYGDNMQLTAVKEVVSDDFIYPQSVLVGIKALASDQLSGSFRFSCEAQCQLIRVSRAGVWTVEYSNNFAWVCYDMLTQPVFNDDNTVARYDGYDPSKIITADFEAWAAFCDVMVQDGKGGLEKRFQFNGGFDSEGQLWAQVNKVAQEARAVLVWRGYSISVIIDQVGTSVQLFSSGNVIQDSFKETFLPMSDRASEMEVSFKNIDKDWERDTFFHFNPNLTSVENKVSVQLIGCTSPSQAWRYADYCLAGNQYWKRTIEFEVDVDALACTIGDVISFQHDVPQWGQGGRVVSATLTSVTLDQDVVLEADHTYGVLIRLNDDTILTRTITNAAGTYTTVNVSSPFPSVPEQYDPFAFGVLGTETKPFRVSSVSRTGDTTFTIEAIEYDANVYLCDSGSPIISGTTYIPSVQLPYVTNLLLSSNAYLDDSGVSKVKINVKWTKPDSVIYAKARIYYRPYSANNPVNYTYAGESLSSTFEISDRRMYSWYEVLVQSVSWAGVTTELVLSPSELIQTPGTIEYSSVYDYRISGLQIFNQANDNTYIGKDCKFKWNPCSVTPSDTSAGEELTGAGNHVPPVWFKDYEVKIFDSVEALRRTEYVQDCYYTYSFEKNYEDGAGDAARNFTIQVLARDRFYNLSKNPTRLNVTNAAPAVPSNIVVTGFIDAFTVRFDPVSETDVAGYLVWASKTLGFTPSDSNLVNRGPETSVVYKTPTGGIWYVKIATYDSFGEDELIYSEEYSGTTYTSEVADGSITEVKIADGAVTAQKMTVSELSAIAADMGAITAGTITLDTGGHIKGGQTAYETGIGFFLGYSGAAYKLSLGGATKYIKWDGSNLDISGRVGSNNFLIDGVNEVIKVFSSQVSITSDINDRLDWSEDGVVKTASLTAAAYTPAELAAHVQVKMRAEGSASTNVTYDSDTRKITIANSSLSTLVFYWYSGTNAAATCGKALGFNVDADDTGALTYTADYQCALRLELGKLD